MKRLFVLFALCAIMVTACEPVKTGREDNTTTSVITISSKTEISVGSGSTMGIITYTIENPVEGATVEATADVEWIGSFDFSQMGKIGYKVEANATYDARVGKITVSYNGQNTVITFNQAGKVRPQEIALEAPYVLGHYFGDYANMNYNYYLVLSSSNYDSNGSFYAAGWKFFIDIYSEERPADYSHIRIPNGVYTFNPNNDGMAGTFLESYSVYKEYDLNGYQVDEKAFSEGTLTVTDDMIKLEVIFDGETDMYVVTFEGYYAMVDKRSESGAIY